MTRLFVVLWLWGRDHDRGLRGVLSSSGTAGRGGRGGEVGRVKGEGKLE